MIKEKLIDVFYWVAGIFFDGLRMLKLWPKEETQEEKDDHD